MKLAVVAAVVLAALALALRQNEPPLAIDATVTPARSPAFLVAPCPLGPRNIPTVPPERTA